MARISDSTIDKFAERLKIGVKSSLEDQYIHPEIAEGRAMIDSLRGLSGELLLAQDKGSGVSTILKFGRAEITAAHGDRDLYNNTDVVSLTFRVSIPKQTLQRLQWPAKITVRNDKLEKGVSIIKEDFTTVGRKIRKRDNTLDTQEE